MGMGTTTTNDATLIDQTTYTSPLVGYCGLADVQFVWSQFGVTARLDDAQVGVASGGLLNRAIEKAAADINRMLSPRYAVSVLRQSSWLKWAAAYITAVTIGRRRGNSVPDQLLAEAQSYIDELKQIASGSMPLVLDNGTLAAPLYNTTPGVTNHVVDSRYYDSKIRRLPTTSTLNQQNADRKQFDADDPFIMP